MTIWRPNPSKLTTLAQENPAYWELCLSRSQYSEAEVVATLADAELVNNEWQVLQDDVYKNVLTDQDGDMGTLEGYASEDHKTIHHLMIDGNGYIAPTFSQNSHTNCFPVKTWQRNIAKTRREIAKIKKLGSKVV